MVCGRKNFQKACWKLSIRAPQESCGCACPPSPPPALMDAADACTRTLYPRLRGTHGVRACTDDAPVRRKKHLQANQWACCDLAGSTTHRIQIVVRYDKSVQRSTRTSPSACGPALRRDGTEHLQSDFAISPIICLTAYFSSSASCQPARQAPVARSELGPTQQPVYLPAAGAAGLHHLSIVKRIQLDTSQPLAILLSLLAPCFLAVHSLGCVL